MQVVLQLQKNHVNTIYIYNMKPVCNTIVESRATQCRNVDLNKWLYLTNIDKLSLLIRGASNSQWDNIHLH